MAHARFLVRYREGLSCSESGLFLFFDLGLVVLHCYQYEIVHHLQIHIIWLYQNYKLQTLCCYT